MTDSIYQAIKNKIDEAKPGLQNGYDIPTIEKQNPLSQLKYLSDIFGNSDEDDEKTSVYSEELKQRELEMLTDLILLSSKDIDKAVSYCLRELTLTNVDEIFDDFINVFPKLEEFGYTSVYHTFLRVATNSNSTEISKFAIGIIGMFDNPSHLNILIDFSRHPDFTLYAISGIIPYASDNLTYKEALIKCLKITIDWGKIHFLDLLLNEENLLALDDVRYAILLNGISNCNFPMYLAFPIALKIKITDFLNHDVSDTLFVSISEIIRNLIEEDQPFGGIEDLEYAQDLIDKYLEIGEHKNTSFHILDTLLSIADISKVDKQLLSHDWSKQYTKAEKLFNSKLDKKLLHDALEDIDNNYSFWVTLRIIQEKKLSEFIPKILDIYKSDPLNLLLIEALGGMEDESTLHALYLSITQITDPDKRIKRPMSQQEIIDDDAIGSLEYAKILSYIGKLNIKAVTSVLEKGLMDFDPVVRDGALQGLLDISDNLITEDMKKKVYERLYDDLFYIVFDAVKLIEKKKWIDAKPILEELLNAHSDWDKDEIKFIQNTISKL